jgi:hypothetical protein
MRCSCGCRSREHLPARNSCWTLCGTPGRYYGPSQIMYMRLILHALCLARRRFRLREEQALRECCLLQKHTPAPSRTQQCFSSQATTQQSLTPGIHRSVAAANRTHHSRPAKETRCFWRPLFPSWPPLLVPGGQGRQRPQPGVTAQRPAITGRHLLAQLFGPLLKVETKWSVPLADRRHVLAAPECLTEQHSWQSQPTSSGAQVGDHWLQTSSKLEILINVLTPHRRCSKHALPSRMTSAPSSLPMTHNGLAGPS